MKLFGFKKNKNNDKKDEETEVFLKEESVQDDKSKNNNLTEQNKKEEKDDWLEETVSKEQLGELAVDVYGKDDELIVKSTLAGVRPEDLEVVVEGDNLIIRGQRKKEEVIDKEDCYYQECYWGGFERVVRLPIKIDQDNMRARLKNGVLTVILGKAKEERKVAVRVEGD
ncbi:hypothetical protein A3B87_01355 [Candidatus Kuenenbacteria bacterium RIFCSPHIGHO2_02_FULL_39_13]|uniref:SHSP domain-containing protein n=1 Tax=Candidatus Kuenenbacteria bacterium RIFCSPHIGHO2_02_FULL_39_13 TaxID=1798561 RepID=A0A1F6FND5_9BACT|nr:MAG: hypothetical protein A3B87_01355 [Candidatus Kuenenbacteria bacterium RIFCSPHIGHO2_02_FULL_39_13]